MAYKEGKYIIDDVADYICHYCHHTLKKPVNFYKLNYLLVYIIAEYRRIHNESLIWDCEIECWDGGFMLTDIIHSFRYRDSYKPFAPICNIEYPNEMIAEPININDTSFITIIINSMIDRDQLEISNEIIKMDIHRKNHVSGFTNYVTDKDIAQEFRENDAIRVILD